MAAGSRPTLEPGEGASGQTLSVLERTASLIGRSYVPAHSMTGKLLSASHSKMEEQP